MTDKWPPGEYRTRDGRRVYILGMLPEMDDGKMPPYVVRGFLLTEGAWIARGWRRDGKYIDASIHGRDLMPPPEVCWMVRYYVDGRKCTEAFTHQSLANQAAESRRIDSGTDVEVIRMTEA